MYLDYYGFSEPPFDLTPNPKFLLLTPRHREALSNLQYGIESRKGLTLVVGEAGTGKTTLIRTVLQTLGRSAFLFYIKNPTLTRAEFIEYMAKGFGLSERAAHSKAAFLDEIERALIARRRAGAHTALIVDEAQSLSNEILEEIRLLANIETDSEKLLPLVIAGQPALGERLNDPELRQLKQRVALRCELGALDLNETAAYIASRIRTAGGDCTRVMTREAVTLIHERSGGIPRTISVLCDNALVGGFAADKRPITRDLVLDVCRDFDLAAPVETSAPEVHNIMEQVTPVIEPAPEPVTQTAVAAPRGRRFRFF